MKFRKTKNTLLVFLNIIFLFFGVVFIANCETFVYVNQAPELDKTEYHINPNKSLEIDLTNIDELNNVGASVLIKDPELKNHILLVHSSKSTYVIVSSHCTHRQKALKYLPDEKQFECSSMGSSRFNLKGEVISGVAESPLKLYDYTIVGSKMVIRL